MKKILIGLLLILCFQAAKSQYTYIAQRYDWLAGKFRALNIPAGDSAQFQTLQDRRSGALYYDSTGVDSGLYVWSGLVWRKASEGGFFTPDQTSTGATSHDANGNDFGVNNIGDLVLAANNTNLITTSDLFIQGDSIRFNSTSGRIIIPNLLTDSDTAAYKPIGWDAATGRARAMTYWPGGGGSVDAYTSVYLIDDTTFALVRDDLTEDTVVISGTADIDLSDYVTETGTQTLTNKRWIPRVGSTTSSATPTINTDNYDIYKLTAQAADITSFTTNLSGTPNDGEILEIQITGTAARAITWGASFAASTVALPSTTVTTATLTVVFQYYTTSSYGNNKWICVNSF